MPLDFHLPHSLSGCIRAGGAALVLLLAFALSANAQTPDTVCLAGWGDEWVDGTYVWQESPHEGYQNQDTDGFISDQGSPGEWYISELWNGTGWYYNFSAGGDILAGTWFAESGHEPVGTVVSGACGGGAEYGDFSFSADGILTAHFGMDLNYNENGTVYSSQYQYNSTDEQIAGYGSSHGNNSISIKDRFLLMGWNEVDEDTLSFDVQEGFGTVTATGDYFVFEVLFPTDGGGTTTIQWGLLYKAEVGWVPSEGEEPEISENKVLSINSPELYSIASTTFPYSFTYQSTGSPAAGGVGAYVVEFTHTLNFTTWRNYEWVDVENLGNGTFIQTGTSTAPDGFTGTVRMNVVLMNFRDADGTPTGYLGSSESAGLGGHVFSIEVADNVQEFVFSNASYSASNCDIDWGLTTFSLSGCVGYLIVPNQAVWSEYSTLVPTFMTKFPMRYVSDFETIRNSIYENPNLSPAAITVPAFGGELTLISRELVEAVPFSGLIRSLLSAMMWLLLIYALYNRVITMHDHNRV